MVHAATLPAPAVLAVLRAQALQPMQAPGGDHAPTAKGGNLPLSARTAHIAECSRLSSELRLMKLIPPAYRSWIIQRHGRALARVTLSAASSMRGITGSTGGSPAHSRHPSSHAECGPVRAHLQLGAPPIAYQCYECNGTE